MRTMAQTADFMQTGSATGGYKSLSQLLNLKIPMLSTENLT